MVLVLFQNSHASSPYVPYEVVEIQKEGILAKDHKGQLHLIKKDPGDTKVGDIIRYDYIRNRLRKSPWQLAKIIEMTESTIKPDFYNDITVCDNISEYGYLYQQYNGYILHRSICTTFWYMYCT